MRLTLRTLLAYLNDVLTPEEAEPLKQRIAESEFASTLVQRIHHVLKRLRLSAPKVDGRGLGFDANSVAEYLDSTMHAERVADFEKVCLESDVHLAEVAAGYEILAKVLSEHAHVPEQLRNRVYALGDRVRHAGASPVKPIPHADNGKPGEKAIVAEPTPPPVVQRPKPQVPDYLKPEPKTTSGAWLLLPVAVLTILGIAFFVPPLNQYNPLVKKSPELANVPTPENNNTPTPPEESKNNKKEKNPEETTPADTQPMLTNGEKDSESEKEKEPVKSTTDEDMTPVEPEKTVASADTPKESTTDKGSAEKPEVKPATSEPSPGAELGRYISDETVLASYNAKSKMWMRVPPRALIVEGQHCISLPVYRPQITLASGAQLTLIGESSVVFGRERNSEQPLVIIDYGRLMVHAPALQAVQTHFNLNGLGGTLTLDTPESIAAVEVYSFLPPGLDPLADLEKPVSLTIANIIGIAGSCTWEEKGKDPVVIPANAVQMLINGEESRKRTRIAVPNWIDTASTGTVDRDAAKILELLLPLDRPLDLTLEEVADHRRLDVRVLVARCLAFLGHSDLVIKQLAEEQYKAYWMRSDGHIETLRKLLARGGGSAESVRMAMIEVRGEKDGRYLYRLLQGYNNKQLVSGEADTLVTALAHPSMDIRVLAIDNLYRITGHLQFYNAWLTPDKSKARIKAWQDVLDKGQIRYATEPSPLTEFKSLEIKPGEAEDADKPEKASKGK